MKNIKNIFAASLMKMLDNKALENITVTDIVNDCKVSRQAFYYHFNDIYAIVGWIYIQQVNKSINNYLNINTWHKDSINLLNWMKQNCVLILNTHKSMSREYVESFMNRVLYDYIYEMVDSQPEALSVGKFNKEFIAKYFALAFNAIVLNWIHTGMKEEPETIVKNIEIMFKGDLKKALINMQN